MLRKVVLFLSLFSSFGTLFCCALPALFVSLGMGAALVSTLSAAPQLIWFSEHKVAVFLFAGAMLAATAALRGQAAAASCPAEPELARACLGAKRASKAVFVASCGLYAVGAFFAFVAPLVL